MYLLIIAVLITALDVGARCISLDLHFYFQALWGGYTGAGLITLLRIAEGQEHLSDNDLYRFINQSSLLSACLWPSLHILDATGKRMPLWVPALSWLFQFLLVLGLQWLAKKLTGYILIGDFVYVVIMLPTLMKLERARRTLLAKTAQ